MMISNAWKNTARLACEALFDCECRVIVQKKYKAADGSVKLKDEVLFENLPCRLSYGTLSTAKKGSRLERLSFTRKNDTLAAEISATVRLFVSADADIPPGSKVVVLKEGREMQFICSGIAAVYPGHREILMAAREEFA